MENVLDYEPRSIADVNLRTMAWAAIKVGVGSMKWSCWEIDSLPLNLEIGKREELVDDQLDSDAEEDLHAYERDLEEDRDDLRRALAAEDNE